MLIKGIRVFVISGMLTLGLMLISFSGYSFIEYSSEYYGDIEQPIGFNHKVHVEDNGMSCEACHSQARHSDSAGTPSVRSCIGCHVSIKGTSEEQQKEIAKITAYWRAEEPILWKKIHDVPDFVKFSHKAHLDVGFDCSSCHGEVSKTVMPVPQSFKGEIPLSMGWCVTCHRTDWAVDENGKIAIPVRETRGGTVVAEAPPVAGHINGPVDCLVCHD
ncbi:MAG: hypothetical protein JJV97_03040 [SAR324 cluster bacterium]|nr:hypothetical protein [SAR324 cluster bacterium]